MKKRLSCMLKADAFGLDGSLLLPSLLEMHVHLATPISPSHVFRMRPRTTCMGAPYTCLQGRTGTLHHRRQRLTHKQSSWKSNLCDQVDGAIAKVSLKHLVLVGISGIRDRIHRLLLPLHAQNFLCSCHLAVLRQLVQQVFLALTGDTAWLSAGNLNDDSGFERYNLGLCHTSRINIDLQKPLNFISNV